MLQKIQKRKEEGFTIIEVLIVLAIAGLILLIVFLAVPALQRNSRNTAIKNDAQNVLGGIAEYQNANSGSMPTSVDGTGTVDYTGSGTNATSIKIQGNTSVSTGSAPSGTNGPSNGTIVVVLGRTCNGTSNTRAAAVYYSIETTSNPTTKQCADS